MRARGLRIQHLPSMHRESSTWRTQSLPRNVSTRASAHPTRTRVIHVMINPRSALLTLVLLSACGSESSGDAARGSATDSTAATPAAAPNPVDTPAPAPAAQTAAPAIVLAPDGVSVTGGNAPQQLAFGSPRAGVLAAVSGVLGEPGEQANQDECPAGPLQSARYGAGLELVFRESEFVGWNVRQGSTLRTAAGIGPGSTLGQLKAAYPAATVEETSLGMEFAASDLYGIVTDASDAGVVEFMFAGINCIFR